MKNTGMVKITKDKQESYVLPESVRVWEDNGWKVAVPDKEDAKTKTREVKTADGDKVEVPASE